MDSHAAWQPSRFREVISQPLKSRHGIEDGGDALLNSPIARPTPHLARLVCQDGLDGLNDWMEGLRLAHAQ